MRTSNLFYRLLSLAAFISSLFFASCSSSTSTPPPTQSTHVLKTGDSFTYHDHEADTSGVAIPGSDSTLNAIVSQTALTIQGKTNVAEIIKGEDTTYFADGTDSSFSLLQNQVGIFSGVSIPAIWISFDPAKNGKSVYDSTQNTTISGMPAKIHGKIVMNYHGKDVVTIAGKSLSIYKFSKVVTVIVTVMGQDYTTVVTVDNDYAPAIGYLTRHNAKTISDSQQSPVPNGISYSELQSYNIK